MREDTTEPVPWNAVTVDRDCHGVDIHFHEKRKTLSSCILNGGLVAARRIINRRVGETEERHLPAVEDPAEALSLYHRRQGWRGDTVGMMTAASMDSFRDVVIQEESLSVRVLVTTGLSNAKRAGERAETRAVDDRPVAGTINIVALVNRPMAPEAMVEAVMIVTEAKTVALADLGVRSSVSECIATGTGTDAVAVVGGNQGAPIRYCGKHVIAGELLARATISALSRSLEWYFGTRT